MILSAASWAAVYFVVWWTTLFAVLPFGVRSQREDGAVIHGTEPGAPTTTRVARIALVTTAISTLLFLALYAVLTQNLVGLDDIPFLPRYDPMK